METASGYVPNQRPDGPAPVTHSTAVLVVWLLSCLGFACVFWVQHRKHAEQTKQSAQAIVSYSNHVAVLEDHLARQVVVNSTLESNLADTKLKASNDLAAIEATLSTTSSSLEKSQAEFRAAEEAIAEKDKQIAQLADQNTELDQESSDLRGSITNLEAQIAVTQKKLDSAEGDKALLLEELARLQAQKDELEKKLSDLAFLKETVRKLKEDLAISRRLDWIRRGIYDAITEKGGERLMHPLLAGPAATNSILDAIIQQNGEVTLNPPASTNTPYTK